jgi:GWxTD domain-containing protein
MIKTAIAFLCLLGSLAAWCQEGKPGDPASGFRLDGHAALEAPYQEWLNMVAHIAAPEEVRHFLQLQSARDRDLFIRLFWRQRDPTAGTEANEFREEIERRFRHVNQYFGRGTPRPGWTTAMGRIYMILGAPNSSESFEQVPGVLPAQVWYYIGDAKLGLPSYFNVTFYKPYGSGEWEVYDPAANGPAALLVDGDRYGTADSRQIYQVLQKKAPTLAGPAFSMTPGQAVGGTRPSLRDSLIMADIVRSPLRGVNPAYAANFPGYKGYVQVDTSVSYIENSHALAILKDDRWGFNLIAFSIKPKKLSIGFDAEENRYDLSFDLTVALMQGENEIHPYQRHYELAMTPGQMAVVKSGGVVIHDSFPVVPGDYRLAVFLKNPVSREFSFFEEAVRVQAAAQPRLATPVLGYKIEKPASPFFFPYKAGSQRLAVDPDRIFAAGQAPFVWLGAYHADRSLREGGRIVWEIKGLNERRPFRQRGERRLSEFPDQRQLNAIEKLAAAPLAADFYHLTVQLVGGDGRMIDSRETTFQISPLPFLPQPSELYNQVPADSPYRMDFIIGQQFRRLGDEEKALYSLERSLQARPDFPDARQALLEVLLAQGQYERVAREAERLPRSGPAAFAGRFLKGQALFGLGDFKAALAELTAASALVDSDANLINLIGRACLELGDWEQAAKAFAASLALKKDQPEIEKLLAEASAKSGGKEK